MTTISSAQVRMYAQSAGFSGSLLDTMTAIAMAESSNRTDVVNPIGCVGLWQINQPVQVKDHPTWTVAYLQNPLNNAMAAKTIYTSQGLSAWETYTNGAYKKYLTSSSSGSSNAADASYTNYVTPSGQTVDLTQTPPGYTDASWKDLLRVLPPYELYKLFQGSPLPGTSGIDPLSALGSVGSAVGSIADSVSRAGDWLSNGQNWIRIAQVAVGAALVVAALNILARPITEPAAKVAALL